MRGTVGATPLVLLVLSAPVGPRKTPTSIQPVIPFRLSDEWNFISRTILPVIYQPELAPGVGEPARPF
jgi:hypothetical protein